VRERPVMTNSTLRLVTALGALAVTSGCSDLNNCDEGSDTPIRVDGGTTDQEHLVFESAPWDAPTPFPAKRRLRFEHNLGVTPFLTKAYLSFDKNGTNGSGGGSVAEVAGNSGLYDCIDSRVIELRNDTCERTFYVRVVALGVPTGETTNHDCGD
jgi:hypothetical protein